MPSNINFYNNVNVLSFENNVTGGLNSKAYGFGPTDLKALSNECPLLWFNRNEYITDGKTFTLASSFYLGSIEYNIIISLTGTLVSSNFTITVSAMGENSKTGSTGAMADTGTKSFSMTAELEDGSTLSYVLTADRYLNGNYDDVDVTLSPSTQSPAS